MAEIGTAVGGVECGLALAVTLVVLLAPVLLCAVSGRIARLAAPEDEGPR